MRKMILLIIINVMLYSCGNPTSTEVDSEQGSEELPQEPSEVDSIETIF